MAITTNPNLAPINKKCIDDTVALEHGIFGQLLQVNVKISDYETMSLDDDYIKKMLMEKLVDEMYKARSISFTKVNDMASTATTYYARIFVTPDDQVRLLRELKVI